MGLTRLIDPATEPVTLAEVLAHLRLDTSNVHAAPSAPTVALVAPAAAGNVDAGVHRYRVTFVTADGETEGGDISEPVTTVDAVADDPMTLDVDETVAENKQVRLINIPVGGTGITARRIYRTAADGSDYLLLTTIADNSTTVYTDNIADAALGAGVPTTNSTADPLVSALIAAAREWAEGATNRALVTQTWRLTLDDFPRPSCDAYAALAWPRSRGQASRDWTIMVPRPNLLTVVAITYVDAAGDTQTLAEDQYVVDTSSLPGRIRPAYGATWPATRCEPNAVTIEYTAGYGAAAAVPASIKAAILLAIADLYRNREAQLIGSGITVTDNPTVRALLGPYLYREAY